MWRKRLSLLSVMNGASKGRTVKALREKVDRLAVRPETSDEANRLRSYLKKVLLAQQLRPDRVVKLPTSEVEAIVRDMLEEGVTFNTEIQAGLVEHRVNTLATQGDLAGLVEATKPWHSSDDSKPFDPLKPSIAPIEGMPLSEKIAKFRVQFWQKSITPLLMSGQSGEVRVLKACDIVLANFSEEEAIDLDSQAAAVLQESITCARALRAIITASTDPDDEEYLVYIHERKRRTDRSIGTSMANAVYSNPNLQSKLEQMIKGAPVIKEYGAKVKAHTASLQANPPNNMCDHFEMLRKMCEDLSLIRSSSSGGLFEKFADLLLARLRVVWNSVQAELATRNDFLQQGDLTALQRCISEATNAFSLERCLTEMQAEVGQLQQRLSGEAKTSVLARALDEWPQDFDTEDETLFAKVASLDAALSGCVGIPVTSAELIQGVQKVCDLITQCTPQHLAKPTVGDIINKVLTCADLMLQLNILGWRQNLCMWLDGARSIVALGRCIGKARAKPDDGALTVPEKAMQELNSALAMAMEQKGKCEKVERTAGVNQLLKAFSDAIGEGSDITAKFGKAFLDDRLAKVAVAVEACENYSGGLHTLEKRWYEQVSGNDGDPWFTLREKGDDILKKIDTKKLESKLAEATRCIDEVKKAEAFLGDAYDAGCTKEAAEQVRLMAIEMHVCVLYWHLTTEQSHDTLRKRVQEQVRHLRGHGVKEKNLLPECMYKRAWDALLTAKV